MSDHFDIRFERKLESSADGAERGITGVRRIELISGAERRRRWSDTDKARILVESFAPGANVSEVARRNGLSPQQLFAWRREARALFRVGDDADAAAPATAPQPPRQACRARSPEPADEVPAFVPLVIASTSAPPPGPPPPPTHPGTVEITIGDAIVRVVGHVETSTLVAVLRAVRRSS
jgi:transposase